MTNAEVGPPASAAPSLKLQAIGVGIVVISAIAFAIGPTFAKLAYDGGSNTLTVITARSILSVVLLWLVMISFRQSLRIGRMPLLVSLTTGVLYAVMLYGLLGAVAFIPVNTAILIFFIHPPLVGLATAYIGEEAISTKAIAALIVAFAGLGLAIGFSLEDLNLSGISLAALAAVACVFLIIGNARAVKQVGGLLVVLYMMVSAAVALCIMFLIFGTVALPVTAAGWIGFGGVTVASTVGILAFFCAVQIIGAVRATMITNIEPLLGIIFAVLILGERISPLQGVGVAMVLASIVAMEWKF